MDRIIASVMDGKKLFLMKNYKNKLDESKLNMPRGFTKS